VTLVTVEDDPAVNNRAALDVERSWQARAGGRIGAYQFPRRLRLGHDLIDPLQPYQRVEVVYPVLADLMLARATDRR
jgi:carboxylesterase